jgi:hypothetical protein
MDLTAIAFFLNAASAEPVGGPREIRNFSDERRLNPMHARKNERRRA